MVPQWATDVVIVVLVVSLVRRVRGGGIGLFGIRGRYPGAEDHERRIAGLEESHRQLAAGDTTADLERRIAELEERVDFAERVLAKQHDAERLAPPRHG